MEYFIGSANAIDFVTACISTYRMAHDKTEIITLNLKMSVFVKTHAQLSNSHHSKTHLKVPNVGNNQNPDI